MVNRYATQGRILIERLRKKPHTYMEMLRYGLSTSPWRRITESLREGESLIRHKRKKDGLTVWYVTGVKA
jgi:hypothetical protein